ncbi:uncharacterized protein K02A2.6-like [Scomber scombrus]|uniref:Uncharacterized protein K02A2.6-like n=1 Tax=Scomber scombrus TaxID=13677 RepID=A0AAV1PL04_SCOSC
MTDGNGEGSGVSTVANKPSATFSIQPPEPFDFSKPQEWTKWIQRFERFHQAGNLSASSEENQLNTLIYCMGDEADDVLRGQKLDDADQCQYDKNIVYERAQFNMRKQEANETALYALAEHCNYVMLHDELIWDRIVVGLADTQLSERMQMEKDLDLDKAINMARQSEEVKKQQTILTSDASGVLQVDGNSVDRVFMADTKKRSLNSPNPKVMEKSHTTVRSKIIKAPSATNVVAHLTLGMNVQQMKLSAIPVEKKVTTSVCAVQAKQCRA